jgi:hypothetical protein
MTPAGQKRRYSTDAASSSAEVSWQLTRYLPAASIFASLSAPIITQGSIEAPRRQQVSPQDEARGTVRRDQAGAIGAAPSKPPLLLRLLHGASITVVYETVRMARGAD